MKHAVKIITLIVLIAASAFTSRPSFEIEQLKNTRVASAYTRKEEFINLKCRALGIPEDVFGDMFIRVFKAESIMEIWVRKPAGDYVKFNTYRIYAMSGKLGPKRMQGDCQVPEGFYYISNFNPGSNYYLSLKVSYPNESDIKLSPARDKGGDIYIHGGHVSAGCMAMSDYYIEDIYICAVKARNGGETKIPVQIYPFEPTPVNLAYYSQFESCQQFKGFWKNLAEGYTFFEKTHHLPEIAVAKDGSYLFREPGTDQASK